MLPSNPLPSPPMATPPPPSPSPSAERNLFKKPNFAEADYVYVYESRSLRIIIQEELRPLNSLSSVKDIGQVFVDIACGA